MLLQIRKIPTGYRVMCKTLVKQSCDIIYCELVYVFYRTRFTSITMERDSFHLVECSGSWSMDLVKIPLAGVITQCTQTTQPWHQCVLFRTSVLLSFLCVTSHFCVSVSTLVCPSVGDVTII